MANDVSFFKVPGDSTTHSFNDADAENKIGALETTVADQADRIAANATNIQTNRTAIGTLSSLTTEAQGNLVAAVNEVDANANQLNSKNYTVISSGQTIDVLTYARSLDRGKHNVYCAASTVTGGPTTDACLYEFFAQGNGLIYIRATRWTSTAANRNVWDTTINTSTSSIVWRQMPSRAEVDSLSSDIAEKTFKSSSYAQTSSYTISLPKSPRNGMTYMVILKHWTSSTTYVIDIILLTFTSATTVYQSNVVKNSTATISSISVSGTDVTLTFAATAYLSAYVISLV